MTMDNSTTPPVPPRRDLKNSAPTKKKSAKIQPRDNKKKLYKNRRRDARDRKLERLELHGFVQNMKKRVKTGKQLAAHAEDAVKIANAFEQLKDALRYQTTGSDDVMENLICRMEDIVALTVSLMSASSLSGFIASIHLYVRTHFTKSTTGFMMSLVNKLFQEEIKLSSQSTGEKTPPTPEENVKYFRECSPIGVPCVMARSLRMLRN